MIAQEIKNKRFSEIGLVLKRIAKEYEPGVINYNEVPDVEKPEGSTYNFWFEAFETIEGLAINAKDAQFERSLIHFEQTLKILIKEYRDYKVRKQKLY